MKRFILLVLCLFCALCFCGSSVLAATGGGGDFGKRNQNQTEQYDDYDNENADSSFFNIIYYLIVGGTPITAYIVYQQRLSKSARATKKVMDMLENEDSAWKYKNILPHFKSTFFAVKSACSQAKFDALEAIATYDMIEKLKMKNAWCDYRHQSRELKFVKLLDVQPVGVFDCPDDSFDHIWFYVEWRALQTVPPDNTKGFVVHKEFWQLMRGAESDWRLSDITDKQDGDKFILGIEQDENLKQN